MTIEVNDRVRVNKTFEAEPLSFIYEGEKGIVIDVTCPNYYQVKFLYKCYWIDEKYLEKIND